MSGSTSPGLGLVVKVMIVLLVLLGIEYVGVLLKLINYSNLTMIWRVIFGLITPVTIIIGLIISQLTENKTSNIVILFLLTFINSMYLLIPVNTYFSMLIYSGDNKVVAFSLIGIL